MINEYGAIGGMRIGWGNRISVTFSTEVHSNDCIQSFERNGCSKLGIGYFYA
jgi:hypothetical protein